MSERPLECSDCKKPVKVCYTEMIGGSVNRISMCQDCPLLQKKMHKIQDGGSVADVDQEICCPSCHTSLSTIYQGADLGCTECYEIFKEYLLKDMVSKEDRSQKEEEKIQHRGRAPGQTTHISSQFRLNALNEALKETLKREDYEQSALLRDQIKEIMEHHVDE